MTSRETLDNKQTQGTAWTAREEDKTSTEISLLAITFIKSHDKCY